MLSATFAALVATPSQRGPIKCIYDFGISTSNCNLPWLWQVNILQWPKLCTPYQFLLHWGAFPPLVPLPLPMCAYGPLKRWVSQSSIVPTWFARTPSVVFGAVPVVCGGERSAHKNELERACNVPMKRIYKPPKSSRVLYISKSPLSTVKVDLVMWHGPQTPTRWVRWKRKTKKRTTKAGIVCLGDMSKAGKESRGGNREVV